MNNRYFMLIKKDLLIKLKQTKLFMNLDQKYPTSLHKKQNKRKKEKK